MVDRVKDGGSIKMDGVGVGLGNIFGLEGVVGLGNKRVGWIRFLFGLGFWILRDVYWIRM